MVKPLDEWIDQNREALIATAQALIRIKSEKGEPTPLAPFGPGVAAALNFMLEYGQARGMKAKNLEGYAGHLEIGQGSELVGILVHVDVVPAGKDWTHPPYGAEIHDGKLFGRGAIDDKGPAVAALFAMRAIHETRLPVRRRARLIIGGDEESGWACMDHYFRHEEQPLMGFTPDAMFPIIIAEKGIVDLKLTRTCVWPGPGSLLRLRGGERPNMVPDWAEAELAGQESFLEEVEQLASAWDHPEMRRLSCQRKEGRILLQVRGVSAHGSTPEQGVNAIAILLSFLTRLLQDTNENREEKDAWRQLTRWAADTSGSELNLDLEDSYTGHLTANLGTLQLEGNELSAVWNIRYPLHHDAESIRARVQERTFPGGSWSVAGGHPPLHVDEGHPLVTTLKKVYEMETGEKAELLSIGGGTYARALEVGVAFGPLFPGREEMAHKKDEYIDLDDLVRCCKIYANALYELMQ